MIGDVGEKLPISWHTDEKQYIFWNIFMSLSMRLSHVSYFHFSLFFSHFLISLSFNYTDTPHTCTYIYTSSTPIRELIQRFVQKRAAEFCAGVSTKPSSQVRRISDWLGIYEIAPRFPTNKLTTLSPNTPWRWNEMFPFFIMLLL